MTTSIESRRSVYGLSDHRIDKSVAHPPNRLGASVRHVRTLAVVVSVSQNFVSGGKRSIARLAFRNASE
jgi:hypothetical protein